MQWIARHRQRLTWVVYAPVLIVAVSLAVAAYFLERNADYSNRSDLRLKTSEALAVRAGMLHRRIQFEIASIGEMQKLITEAPELPSDIFMRRAEAMLQDNPDLLWISATDVANQSLRLGRDGIDPVFAGPKSFRQKTPQDYMLGTPTGFETANFGPLMLIDSGTYGIRVTMPVFTKRNGAVVHWGSVTGIIDAEKFFRKAGINYFDGQYFLAIRLDDGNDGSLKPFFRSDQVRTVFSGAPELTSLNVLSDTWRIAALPAEGWARPPTDVWTMRGILLAIGAMILLPFFRSARLRRLNELGQEALDQRELVLQRLTKRLDLALESYQCGIWEAAHNVEDTYWDERMQELHGVRGRVDWATRRNWLSLIHPDDKKRAAEALKSAAANFGRLSLTARIIRPDGEARSIRYVGQYHEGQDGDYRLFGIAVDVTDYVANAEELRLAKLEAEQKNRELENALAQLSGREHELRLASERLKLAAEAYGCGIWESNFDTEAHYWDPRMRELYGVEMADGRTNADIWLAKVHPEDRERAWREGVAAVARGGHLSTTYRIMPTPDTVRHLRVVGFMHKQPGEVRRFIGLAVDTTEDVLLQEALREAKREAEDKNQELIAALDRLSGREADLQEVSRRLQLATQTYGCGVWEADLDTGIALWDHRMHEMFGIPYVDGHTEDGAFKERIHPDDRASVAANIGRAIETGERYSCNYRIVRLDGAMRHVHAVGQTHRSVTGTLKFIGIALDVTEEKQRNEALIAAKNDAEARRAELEAMHAKLQYNATHDPLTGLQNRRALDAELERLATVPREPGNRTTLLHIDLDRFKQINDTLGHAAGDAMLLHAADVLVRNTRKNDLVARIGGDEFVVLVRNGANNREIAALAQRIVDRMNVPVEYDGHECRFGVSIGIAREHARRNSVKNLLVNADIALYRAKAAGRNRYEFFTSSLQAEIHRNKTLADEILRGLENREFEAWYQPQFCAHTHDLTGVEALVRWNHPERGLLTPDTFLKNAEEINALATIDAQVLEQSLADAMNWASKGLMVPKISVNVSARRLRDDQLLKSLKDLSIAPGQIAFELVESIYLDDDDDVITRNIRRLKGLGIDIEIDDFGTGHTSIVSLLKLEPKRLKIDRQLVQPMLTASREFSLVRSIIEIGTSLDIETVAEGVETMTHAMRLREMGCSALQGYAFARPMRGTDLIDFVAASPWREQPRLPYLATGI